MAFIEKLRQKQGETAAAKAKEQEPQGPTLKEILANGEQSRLFGMYLEEQKESGLAQKMMEGELSGDDLDALGERRKEFLEVTERVKEFREQLDAESVAEVVEASPDLQKIAELVGQEGIRDAVLKRLSELAIREPDRFANMNSAAEALRKTKKSVAEENENIEKLCKQYKVTEDEYMAAVQDRNPKAVENLIEDKMGIFKKLWKERVSGSLEFDLKAADKTSVIKNRVAELDRDLAQLGGSLRSVLVENGSVRKALITNLKGEKVPQQEPGTNFSEANRSILEAAEKATKIPTADVQKEWEAYKQKHKGDTGFSVDEARGKFLSGYASSMTKNKKGFWATIVESIIVSLMKSSVELK
jgi:hypothetical protein